jgi:hypothetical protein
LGKCNARFSSQAAFFRSPTREEKSIFAVCAEAEAGKFFNLTKDISEYSSEYVTISLVLSGTWTQTGNVTAKVTVLAYWNFFF